MGSIHNITFGQSFFSLNTAPTSFNSYLANDKLENAKADALKAAAKDIEEYREAYKNYKKVLSENGVNSKEFDFWSAKTVKIEDAIWQKIASVFKDSPHNYNVKEPDWLGFSRDLAHNKTRADKFSDAVDNNKLLGNNAIFVIDGMMEKIMGEFPALLRLGKATKP